MLGLEALIVAKHTVARDQDIEDLRNIAKGRLKEIDRSVVEKITNDSFKAGHIRKDLQVLGKY